MIDEHASPAAEPAPSSTPQRIWPVPGTPPDTGPPTGGVPEPARADGPAKASRRNYAIMFTDAIGYFTAITFFTPQTILQEFATHLTSANVLIGLITSISWSAVAVMQLAATGFVERLPIKKWFLVIVATVERIPLLVLVILTPVLADTRPGAMLLVLYGCLATQHLLMGCAIPAYSIVYSKVIPPRQRGTLYGLSTTLANALRIGIGLLIPYLLTAHQWWGGFPNGFALCFLIGLVILVASFIPFAFTDEPRDEVPASRSATRDYARAIRNIVLHDRDFRYYAVFGCFSVFAMSGTAFYVTYALRELGAPEGESGWFTVLMAIGTMMAILWGRIADRSNNRMVLVLATVLVIVAPVWALFAPGRFWFYPVILVTAVAVCGIELFGFNLTLEFSAPAHVARYVALFAAAQFLPRLAAPLFAGALADAFGFKAVFAMAALSGVAALAVLSRMRDPRGRVEAAGSV